jgi:4-hydroxy 2-oxovalerate aldolase
VSGAEILIEAGRRKLVGGQEDQLIEIAVGLAQRQRQG